MERVSALTGDDVEYCALDVAVLGRRSELQHLHFLDRVRVGPRRGTDVGAVNLVLVLVGAVAERLGRCALANVRRGADAWSRIDQIEIGEASDRSVLHPLAAVVRADFGR